jgi:hypothetical protein
MKLFWRPKETLIFNRPPGLVIIFFYKIITGIGELVLGFIFLFFIRGYIQQEISEDPQDAFLGFLIHGIHFKPEAAVSVGNLFIFFGVLKLIIALAVWLRSHTLRKGLVVFLAMVTSYSFVITLFHFTFFRAFCFLADLAILLFFRNTLNTLNTFAISLNLPLKFFFYA